MKLHVRARLRNLLRRRRNNDGENLLEQEVVLKTAREGSNPSLSATTPFNPNSAMMPFLQWPRDRALPTPSEWDAALERYRDEMDRAYSTGYIGDAGISLAFMMTTYNRSCWWDFFFPDERIEDPKSAFRLRCRPSWYDDKDTGGDPNG